MVGKDIFINGVVAMAAIGLGVNAYAVDVSPSTAHSDWPSSGEVNIVDGVITVGNDDVEKVQGWTKITSGGNSGILFQDITKSIVVKAEINASYNPSYAIPNHIPSVTVKNCASIEFRGSMTGYWANTKVKFYDSNVIIGSEKALLPKSIQYNTTDKKFGDTSYCIFYFNAGSDYGSVTFRKPEWDQAGWTGKKVFTNNSDIVFYVARGTAYNTHFAQTMGSRSADEYLVQNGTFWWAGFSDGGNGASYIYFRGNYEQISGFFGRDAYEGQATYFRTNPSYSGTPSVKLSGDTVFYGADLKAVNRRVSMYNYLPIELGHRGGTFVALMIADELKFNAENVLTNSYCLAAQVNNQPILAYTASNQKPIDLNGYDQRVEYLTSQWGYYPADKPSLYTTIKSDTPATLSLYKEGGMTYENSVGVAPKFTGKISVEIDNGTTNYFYRAVSDTEGSLTIKSGALRYGLDGGWGGGAVNIEGGALICDSANTVIGGNSALTMTGGKIIFADNCSMLTFQSATIGGTKLKSGVYSLEKLRADPYNLGSYFEGSDSARIYIPSGESGGWTGWPDAPNGIATIPDDTDVVITSSDLWKVQQLAKIVIGVNSSIDCSNIDSAIDISAQVSGFGLFKIINCADVTISGDNSGLESPGAFYIENSEVKVAHPNALGTAKTAITELKYGATRRVHFRVGAELAFTNEVPLRLSAIDATSSQIRIGEGIEGYKLYLACDIYHKQITSSANKGYHINYFGYVELSGSLTIENSSSANWFVQSASTENNVPAYVRFAETFNFKKNTSNNLFFYHTASTHANGVNIGEFHYACTEPQTAIATFSYNIAHMHIDSPTVFGGADSPICSLYYYADVGDEASGYLYLNRLFLNGRDTAFKSVGEQYSPTETSRQTSHYAEVYSAIKAQLIYRDTGTLNDTMRFYGKAGFTMAGSGRHIFVNHPNTSTGLFKVESGVAGFDWGSGWAGDVRVEGTGTLFIGEESSEAFGSAVDTTTLLEVNGSGKIELESGVTTVAHAKINGAMLRKGNYSASDFDWITGSGTLKVLYGGGSMSIILKK